MLPKEFKAGKKFFVGNIRDHAAVYFLNSASDFSIADIVIRPSKIMEKASNQISLLVMRQMSCLSVKFFHIHGHRIAPFECGTTTFLEGRWRAKCQISAKRAMAALSLRAHIGIIRANPHSNECGLPGRITGCGPRGNSEEGCLREWANRSRWWKWLVRPHWRRGASSLPQREMGKFRRDIPRR